MPASRPTSEASPTRHTLLSVLLLVVLLSYSLLLAAWSTNSSSTMSQPFALFGLIFACVTIMILEYKKRTKHKLPLPPSIKPDPLIGHLRYIPSTDEPRVYRDWGKELGSDIVSMSVLGQSIIVVNSLETATELLARRSPIYSDRPELPMLNDERLVGWGNNTGNIRYGDNWRTQRRLTHSVLHKKASEDFWPVMIKHTRQTLQRLLDHPENFIEEFRRMSGSTLLSSVYGYEVTSSGDELVKVVENAVHRISEAALAGNFYVNTIVWLKYIPSWFPGAAWKRTANAWRKEIDQMVNVPFNWAKNQIASGTAAPSVVGQMLGQMKVGEKSHDADYDQEERIRWATATLFAVIVFVLAMVLHPDVQKRAQAEIDALLGDGRLPEMSDRESLPYVSFDSTDSYTHLVPNTNFKEFPMHLPKMTFIETTIFLKARRSNTWAICNDPTIYPEPDKFKPERFLDPSVPNAPGFGFGRRSCPGVHFAEAALFITMCTLLMVFNIRPKQDEAGNDVLPEVKKGPNLMISYPLPFECSITPRSAKREKILRQWVDV
ncbi:hypothetical protein FRC10_006408 [Ceratobasidium sp. 414]|nr:hypothetical protein FRC10_006408 [Ceratobasidium sp. 414]